MYFSPSSQKNVTTCRRPGQLRAIPRTATVTARTTATVYELNRDTFLTAVLGHAPTQRQADRIADARLAGGAEPGQRDVTGPGAAGPG
jgi:CRP-like cAMP-binding protein